MISNKSKKTANVNDIEFLNFKKELIYRRTDIYIPQIHRSVSKTSFMTRNGYDFKAEREFLLEVYNSYVINSDCLTKSRGV
jgi:hypothetical protein